MKSDQTLEYATRQLELLREKLQDDSALLQRLPQRNDILVYLDQKIDLAEAKAAVDAVDDKIAQYRTEMLQTKDRLAAQITQQYNQFGYLQKQSQSVTEFQREYQTLCGQCESLTQTVKQIEQQAVKNIAEYQSERDFIAASFDQLNKDIKGSCDRVDVLEMQQNRLEMLSKDLAKTLGDSYYRVETQTKQTADGIEKMLVQVPVLLNDAKDKLLNEAKQLLQAERARRSEEQNLFLSVTDGLSKKLERAMNHIAQQQQQFEEQAARIEAQAASAIDKLEKEIRGMAQAQNVQILAVQTQIEQATAEQRAQAQKLAGFDTSFRQVESLWQKRLGELSALNDTHAEELQKSMDDQARGLQKQLQKSTEVAERAVRMAQSLQKRYDDEFAAYNAAVDERLLQLRILENEITSAVSGEKQERSAAIDQMEKSISRLFGFVETCVRDKMSRQEAAAALAGKVDRSVLQ